MRILPDDFNVNILLAGSNVASYIRHCRKGIGATAEDGYHYRRPIHGNLARCICSDGGLYGVRKKNRAIVGAKIKKEHRSSEIGVAGKAVSYNMTTI